VIGADRVAESIRMFAAAFGTRAVTNSPGEISIHLRPRAEQCCIDTSRRSSSPKRGLRGLKGRSDDGIDPAHALLGSRRRARPWYPWARQNLIVRLW
jgi:hypothetical protein